MLKAAETRDLLTMQEAIALLEEAYVDLGRDRARFPCCDEPCAALRTVHGRRAPCGDVSQELWFRIHELRLDNNRGEDRWP